MPPQEEGRTLWVGSLSPRLKERDVRDLFSRQVLPGLLLASQGL